MADQPHPELQAVVRSLKRVSADPCTESSKSIKLHHAHQTSEEVKSQNSNQRVGCLDTQKPADFDLHQNTHASISPEAGRDKLDDQIKCPVIIEFFCGTARVTAALRTCGLDSSFGVDHMKSSAVAPIKICDLTSLEGQRLLFTWLSSPLVRGVHVAPPCGTCSVARSIQLRDWFGRPIPGPVPLRSSQFPEGLRNLSKKNRSRVSSANILYELVGRILRFAVSRNLVIVVENPRSSLFWETKWWKNKGVELMYTAHQACAYGSDRPKWTVLAHNRSHFRAICKTCPGSSHKHKPWGLLADGSFATHAETSYPPELARAIANCFALALKDEGWIPPAVALKDDWHDPSLNKARAVAGSQPKASKLPPIVAEHKVVLVLTGPAKAFKSLQPMCRLKRPWQLPQQIVSATRIIPAESQLLRSTPLQVMGGYKEPSSSGEVQQAWGVPYTPSEFVSEAFKSGHPKTFRVLLPKPLEEALKLNTRESLHELVDKRARWFRKWLCRAKELSHEEQLLKESMPEHLSKILAKKNLVLWKEMLHESGYPDLDIFEEVSHGTVLVGNALSSGVFDKKFRPADLAVDSLVCSSEADRKALLFSARSSGSEEVDRAVYEKTMEEVSCGWAKGPIPVEQMPNNAIVSRRFGLKQPGKIRLIDDLSGSHINSTVQADETPRPHSTDVIASVALSLVSESSQKFLGRTYDLKSAYKQLGISASSLWAAYVVVFNPFTRKPEVFQLLALPFGATKSVYTFLRVAHSLWWLGTHELGLVWTNFYDDFVTFARHDNRDNTHKTIDLFFRSLGWSYAVEGDKANPFAETFNALGIVIDLSCFKEGCVSFSNTAKRTCELVSNIEQILKAGCLSLKDSQRLRGRMQFADSQLFGRCGKLCLSAITEHTYKSSRKELDKACVDALKRFKSALSLGKPRVIQKATAGVWMVFTDACFEPDSPSWRCGLGGVIVSPDGSPFQFFSHRLCDNHIHILGGDIKQTIIFEAELLALVVAMELWSALFQHAPVLFFIDNNGARDVAISGNGRFLISRLLLDILLSREMEAGVYAWYARVPSPSNPADAPSRGVLSHDFHLGTPLNSIESSVDATIAFLCKGLSENGGLER